MQIRVLLICLVSGCASSPPDPVLSQPFTDAFGESFRGYIACMDRAAVRYAPSSALVGEVAEIAHSACRVYYEKYARALENEYLRLSPHDPQATARAASIARDASRDIKGRVMRLVAEERMESGN